MHGAGDCHSAPVLILGFQDALDGSSSIEEANRKFADFEDY
jgi:hypothetical protein